MVLTELLAPAGSYDIFVVAVNAGADAVYLAGQQFGARAFAKNFTMKEIKKAINYAHLNGVKIHVTVNTLVNDFEIKEVIEYLFELYKIGVDAVIVQDFGIAYLLKKLIPNFEIHASTQMALNNYSSIKWAAKNGISRVVLPREININEIAKISKKLKEDNLDIELEVFGHGALCYSVSGNCYISSYNSGRSGNRGACAQPCRREYKLKYRGYNVGNGYLLSTHDLATYDHLDEISSAGVTSLKLEGRMKGEDYIGTIVNSYRNILDGNEGSYKKDLHLVFNRQFTDGYLLGEKPGNVMGRNSSGHEGLYIGDIVKKEGDEITIKVENPIPLEIGDGIAFKYNKKIKGIYLDNIVKQDENEIVIKTTRLVKEGTEVFISYSNSIHEKLKQFKKERIKSHIPISLAVYWNEDLTVTIKVEYYLKDTLVNFKYKSKAKFEKAINKPITKEKIKNQLSKTGGSPFLIKDITFNNMPKDIFISIRELNKMRRDIIKESEQLLLNHQTPTKKSVKAARKNMNKFLEEKNTIKTKKKPELSIFIDNLELLKEASGYNLKRVYFDGTCLYNNPEDYYKNIANFLQEAALIAPQSEIVWVLSSFLTEEEAIKSSEIINQLENKGILISVMVDSPGMKNIFKCNVYGHHNLNIWNSYSGKNLSQAGFSGLIVSSELSAKEIKELTSKTQDIQLDMIVNGNLEVIVTKDDFSNLNNGKDFIIANNSDYAILEDKKRKKFKYKVAFDYNRQSHIINKDCLCLIEEINEIKDFNLDSVILDCRYSSESYTKNILSIYYEGLKGKDKEELDKYRHQIMDFSHSYINKGSYIEGRLHEN